MHCFLIRRREMNGFHIEVPLDMHQIELLLKGFNVRVGSDRNDPSRVDLAQNRDVNTVLHRTLEHPTCL